MKYKKPRYLAPPNKNSSLTSLAPGDENQLILVEKIYILQLVKYVRCECGSCEKTKITELKRGVVMNITWKCICGKINGWSTSTKNGKNYHINKLVAFGFFFSNQSYREYSTYNCFKNQLFLSKTYLDEIQNQLRKPLLKITKETTKTNFNRAVRFNLEKIIDNEVFLCLPAEIIDIIWGFMYPNYYIGIMTDGMYGGLRNSTSNNTSWMDYYSGLIIEREHIHKETKRGNSDYIISKTHSKNLEYDAQENILKRSALFQYQWRNVVVAFYVHDDDNSILKLFEKYIPSSRSIKCFSHLLKNQLKKLSKKWKGKTKKSILWCLKNSTSVTDFKSKIGNYYQHYLNNHEKCENCSKKTPFNLDNKNDLKPLERVHSVLIQVTKREIDFYEKISTRNLENFHKRLLTDCPKDSYFSKN
jgi:hypothetical protein